MKNALKNVSIADLVTVHIFKGIPTEFDKMPYEVVVDCLDRTKRVVFDVDALKVVNQKVTEKVQQFKDGRDPKVVEYIKEFVTRMLVELHKNGLVILEDIPEAEDPYASVRNVKLPNQ